MAITMLVCKDAAADAYTSKNLSARKKSIKASLNVDDATAMKLCAMMPEITRKHKNAADRVVAFADQIYAHLSSNSVVVRDEIEVSSEAEGEDDNVPPIQVRIPKKTAAARKSVSGASNGARPTRSQSFTVSVGTQATNETETKIDNAEGMSPHYNYVLGLAAFVYHEIPDFKGTYTYADAKAIAKKLAAEKVANGELVDTRDREQRIMLSRARLEAAGVDPDAAYAEVESLVRSMRI
jgi:hypothetical protein